MNDLTGYLCIMLLFWNACIYSLIFTKIHYNCLPDVKLFIVLVLLHTHTHTHSNKNKQIYIMLRLRMTITFFSTFGWVELVLCNNNSVRIQQWPLPLCIQRRSPQNFDPLPNQISVGIFVSVSPENKQSHCLFNRVH